MKVRRNPIQDLALYEMQSQVDAEAFRKLNQEWIERLFRLEEKDLEMLTYPQEKIVAKGGHVYLAKTGEHIVGCVALLSMPGHIFEVAKMAVSPVVQGKGLGRKLLEYAVEQARTLGAAALYLESSQRLPNAIHLYEALGFQHIPETERKPSPYARADVFMRMAL